MLSKEDQEKIVGKAKHYLNLIGSDLTDKMNISALAMVIGWVRGSADTRKDSIATGVMIAEETRLITTMITCAHTLAMECETMEEAFLEEEGDGS